MEREGIHLWVFKGLLGLLAIMAVLVLVRQLGFYGIGHIHKIVLPAVLVASTISLVGLVRDRSGDLKVDALFLLLVALALGGLLQGGIALALGSIHHGVRQFVPHAFVGIAAPVIYLAFANHSGDFSRIYRLGELASPIIVAAFGVTLAMVYAVFLPQGGFYLGFSSEALVVPLAVAIVSRRYFLALVTIVLILLSGKRGVLLVLPLLIALQIYFAKVSRLRLVTLIGAGAVASVVAVIGAIVAQRLGMAPAFLDKIFLAGSALTKFNDPHALAVATSGRSLELESAVALLNQTGTWFTGLGYGFGFFVPNVTGDYVAFQHYVHITPFNYVMQNGVILTVILYASLGAVFLRAARVARRHGGRAEQFLVLLTTGYLVVSITSFTAGSDAMYWVLLGLLGAIASTKAVATAPAIPESGNAGLVRMPA